MRVTTSGLLPAAAGVMNVTGLVGKSCAAAPLAIIAAAAMPIAVIHCNLINSSDVFGRVSCLAFVV
jgi:hypothetical protein